ncbi:Uncharacterised protein [Mycobacteroides abscessus subsp. massiliense]|nr:Uncharacterised protein [Mycobacteroides abscessus subsp. massiliense]
MTTEVMVWPSESRATSVSVSSGSVWYESSGGSASGV